jgi:trehalose-6-phosphate synthase
MTTKERKTRMRKLRRKVRNEDVFRWCANFCSHLEAPGAHSSVDSVMKTKVTTLVPKAAAIKMG